MMSLLASVFAGAATFLGSLFGLHMNALMQHDGSSTPMDDHASTTSGRWGDMHEGSSTMPVLIGKVTSVDGVTLSVLGRTPGTTASTTYTVDATNAKIYKKSAGVKEIASSTVSSIQTGDNVFVIGTISGTSIEAKSILDGIVPVIQAMGRHMGSSTPMMRPDDHRLESSTMHGEGEMHGFAPNGMQMQGEQQDQ